VCCLDAGCGLDAQPTSACSVGAMAGSLAGCYGPSWPGVTCQQCRPLLAVPHGGPGLCFAWGIGVVALCDMGLGSAGRVGVARPNRPPCPVRRPSHASPLPLPLALFAPRSPHPASSPQSWSAELAWRPVAVEKPMLLRQRSDGFEKGLKVGGGFMRVKF
jgi:hypothetical protein